MSTYSCLNKWSQMPQREPDPKTVCSFCKQITVAEKLIGGPSVNICTECVDLCKDIIADRQDVHRKKTIEDIAKTLVSATQLWWLKEPLRLPAAFLMPGIARR